jgi:hypothetical protein
MITLTLDQNEIQALGALLDAAVKATGIQGAKAAVPLFAKLVNYGVVSPSLTLTVQMELSDADSERIVAYLMAATSFGTVTENVVSPDGESQSWVTRPATPEEAITTYAESVMNSILQQAYQWDQQRAAAEAAANVPPITPIQPPAPV